MNQDQSFLPTLLLIMALVFLVNNQQSCQPVTPPAPINPPPLVQPGLRVMVLYESKDRTSPILAAIMASDKTRRLLESRCVAENSSPCFRFFDVDTSIANSPQWVRDAMNVKRESLPWLVVSNGKAGESRPLPGSVDEFCAVVERYAE